MLASDKRRLIIQKFQQQKDTSDCNEARTHNRLVRKPTHNHLVKLAILAKWLSIHLQTKWLGVRVLLHSRKLQISRLFRERSSLTFRQL